MSRYDFSDRSAVDTQQQQQQQLQQRERERAYDLAPFSVSLPSDRRLSLAKDPLALGGLGEYPRSMDGYGGQESLLGPQEDVGWGPFDLDNGGLNGAGGGGGGGHGGRRMDGLWTRLSDGSTTARQPQQQPQHISSPTSSSLSPQSRLAAFPSSPFPHNLRSPFLTSAASAYTHGPAGHLFSHQHQHQHFPPASSDSPDPLLQAATARSLPNAQNGLSLPFVDTSFGPHQQRSSLGGQAHPSTHPLNHSLRSTLWWGELEPWMDEEYARQVCGLMGWDQVSVTIPQQPSDGQQQQQQQSNNPGYCFLTFPSPQHAAAVLTQINNAAMASGTQPILPNSNKPFVLNWASSPATSPSTQNFPVHPHSISQNVNNLPPHASASDVQSPVSSTAAPAGGQASNAQGQNQSPASAQKEYSIFVGDLAPETSNSDLVAVFRNPVLGLRNDRAPKFIRPFYSCKSAKIMLDPVTGVSRGYGFVRFTEEADQQRALIEMHGLYCLSRPMRISPATAKFKTAGGLGEDASGGGLPAPAMSNSRSGSSMGSSSSLPSMTASTTASSMSSNGQPTMTIEALAQLIASATLGGDAAKNGVKKAPSITAPLVTDQQKFDESLKHQEQARAILGNLVGPNGEQLTSTDPYNTTVFVGGLSPLISEETLRTFFAPFGDIHYVKVPAGKHCGFVQFVRKADAERAIERMQGFPIGGSRIRLSWGRSQYKAAQAAAQAAAAAQAQATQQPTATREASALTSDQAMEILQKLGFAGIFPAGQTSESLNSVAAAAGSTAPGLSQSQNDLQSAAAPPAKDVPFESPYYSTFPSSTSTSTHESRFGGGDKIPRSSSGFSPFSPDPNYLANLVAEREANAARDGALRGSGTSKSISQRFGDLSLQSPSVAGGGAMGARSATPSMSGGDAFLGAGRAAGLGMDGGSAPARPASGQAKAKEELAEAAMGHRTSQTWEGGADAARSPVSTTDSNGSVQFRMSMSSPTVGSP